MTETEAGWTLEELGEQVADALASDYPGPANGQVRAIPDVRTIRYYASLGLLDRPAGSRGRTALYGRRHLLQLVAIKRLQAEGRSLQEVQQQLIGLGGPELEEVARVPALLSPATVAPAPGPVAEPRGRRSRFWSELPAMTSAVPEPAEPPPSRPGPGRPTCTGTARPGTMISLDDAGAFLWLPGTMAGGEVLDEIQMAARPLIELLRARGLCNRIKGEG